MRAIGLGSCSMMARIGAIVTPFVAQVQSIALDIVWSFTCNCFVLLKHGYQSKDNFHALKHLTELVLPSLIAFKLKNHWCSSKYNLYVRIIKMYAIMVRVLIIYMALIGFRNEMHK